MSPKGYSPAFQVDTDNVGSVLAHIGYINTRGSGWDATPGGTGGQTISFWTSDPTQSDSSGNTVAHRFGVGQSVEIRGLPAPYDIINGVHQITAVGDTDVPGAYFNIQFATNLPVVSTDTLFSNAVLANGLYDWALVEAFSPPPSYVRYYPHDTLLDNVVGHTTLHAEPWDYNTIRIVWGVDDALDARAAMDVGAGLVPLMAITRSGFGFPSTPLDGQRILLANYEDTMASLTRPRTSEYFETQAASPGNDWNRPSVPIQGLYDRNLPSGHWFYYSLFFFLGQYDAQGVPVKFNVATGLPQQYWVRGNTMDVITPVNHQHALRLYDLIPEYYQNKDQEFLAGTGRRGVLERLTQIVGFEADYTRTLADGVEHVYDVDHMQDDLLHSQGVFNFGVQAETGLGDIRYRSLLATVSKLYEERGSAGGLQKMTMAASKYRCKVIEGINMMNLTDDAEFATDTGSWGNPVPEYAAFVRSKIWMSHSIANFNAVRFNSTALLTTPEGSASGDSLVLRRNAMRLGGAISGDFDSSFFTFDDPSAFDGAEESKIVSDINFDDQGAFNAPIAFDGSSAINNGVLITCGLGSGVRHGRRHEPIPTKFYPRLHGIKCKPGTIYTFTGHTVLKSTGTDLTGLVAVGIMWFNDDQGGFFDINRDFIAKDESSSYTVETHSVSAEDPGPFQRLSVDSQAPVSLRGQPFVFAVPFFIFANTAHRYISACMFYAQLNASEQYSIPPIKYLTLGIPSEPLDSIYVLGEP